MAGTLFWVDAIQVFIGAEDHPPPHVHAVHLGDGWVARFRFSFLSDVTGLYRFRRRGRRPTGATLDRVAVKPGRTAVVIVSASYDPHSGRVRLILNMAGRFR